MASMSRGRPRIRVAVALLEEGKLLLVEHCKDDHRYWLLPGGGLEWGEGLKDAARRELLEETGVEAEIGHLLLASETVSPDSSRHLLHMVFSARRLGSSPHSPTSPAEERITDVRWVPLSEVASLVFHPPIGPTLAAMGEEGLSFSSEDKTFLGNLWID